MFTGLVDDVGTIERVASTDAGRELRVRTRYTDLQAGESIAVQGVCLTVCDTGPGWFSCAAVPATLLVTTISDWTNGRRVNLERALRPTDRLGGHFVQGHVDGVAQVVNVEQDGAEMLADLALPDALPDLMVPRGSVAVDGVSLTIQALLDGPMKPRRSFRVDRAQALIRVALIEHTRSHTTLGALQAGDMVHVEADVIAKHVQKLLAPFQEQ